MNIKTKTKIRTKYEKTKRYPDTFGELPLPSRDSEIRGAIARIAKPLQSSNVP